MRAIRAGALALASTTWRYIGAKIPRPAFEGIEERLEFLEKRREHIATSTTRPSN
jgi:hypothetical protein